LKNRKKKRKRKIAFDVCKTNHVIKLSFFLLFTLILGKKNNSTFGFPIPIKKMIIINIRYQDESGTPIYIEQVQSLGTEERTTLFVNYEHLHTWKQFVAEVVASQYFR